MSEGRGSASMNIVTMMISLICLLFLAENINAETHIVGGVKGWTFNTKNWPNGKEFSAGDVLVFNYNSKMHNVVAVDKAGYTSCKTPAAAGYQTFTSGSDQIKLESGENYFICNFPGHCQTGMKIFINAV
ncbi:basic blue protein-like [Vicia villosa]|uniref:basic blue protein-like n=1 Tax=Vicia villosa TaxID=3911 RepID=UPI00273A93C8|nr:basic blue protein-like [Vicia villosa]